MPANSADIGSAGEAYVAGRLARAGYRIIARNWRAQGGELDIVAILGDFLVFVEVRVRTGDMFGSADESVDRPKLTRLITTANRFIVEHPEYSDTIWRVDLVALTLTTAGAVVRYHHYENLTLE